MFCPAGPLGANMGIPTWTFPCWSHLGPTSFFTWDALGHSHLGIPMLVPIGTYFFLSYGICLGTPTWAFPCWSQLGPIFIFMRDTFGHPQLGNPMLFPIGTHIYFHMGYTWAPPIGHSHVGPKCDPYLFLYGIHLGTPILAFPCSSHMGPTSFFMWDTPGHSHLGITM